MGKPVRKGTGADAAQATVAYFRKEATICLTDDGECTEFSANCPAVLNQRRSSLLGKGFTRHLSDRDRKKLATFLVAKPTNKTIRLQRQDEWLEVSFIRESGQGSVVLLQNITSHVQQSAALRKASLDAELALRGQSEFFAHISHELRTPLNAIMGFSEIMHQEIFGEIDNPRYRDYLDILRQSSQDLLKKINDLLEISSLTAGIEEVNDATIPLEELFRTAINVHARDLFRRHIRVDMQLFRCTVIADRLKLQQALTHLLHNSIKFSPEESLITISSELTQNGSLNLIICDEGSGFSPQQLDYLERSKENFSFLERNRKLIGFGLPLAQELIFLHGGSLQCRNRECGGAEITICLPRERVIGVQEFRPARAILPDQLEHCA